MKAIYQYIIPALVLLLPACQREEMLPEPVGGGNAQGIPLEIEDLSTRMEVASVTGVCAWTDGDQIGLYLTGGNADAYVSATVNATSRIATPASAIGPDRVVGGYAVYPYDMRGNGATPTVNYLTTYNMSGRDLSNVSSAPNVPMLAAGNSDLLRFYHVGAMMRLSLVDMPSNTNRIRVTFEGMTDVTGEATVTDPGTRKASAAITTGTGNVVNFTNITLPEGTMYLTVPLPVQDYSALTGMKVEAMSGNSVAATFYCPVTSSWGALKHGDALPYPVDFISVIHLPGYTGASRGIFFSPGLLVKQNGVYTLTDGSDQLELLDYFGQESGVGTYYHEWHQLRSDLGSLNGGINPASSVLPSGWVIPSQDQYSTAYGGTNANSLVNGELKRWSMVQVELSGTRYDGKGLSDGQFNTSFQLGFMLIPDYCSVNCPGLKGETAYGLFGKTISLQTLYRLVEGGCVFFPASARYVRGFFWTGERTSNGEFWTSTSNSTRAWALHFYVNGPEFVALSNEVSIYYVPLRLAHE